MILSKGNLEKIMFFFFFMIVGFIHPLIMIKRIVKHTSSEI